MMRRRDVILVVDSESSRGEALAALVKRVARSTDIDLVIGEGQRILDSITAFMVRSDQRVATIVINAHVITQTSLHPASCDGLRVVYKVLDTRPSRIPRFILLAFTPGAILRKRPHGYFLEQSGVDVTALRLPITLDELRRVVTKGGGT